MKPLNSSLNTYSGVRLGILLLGMVDNKLGSFFAAHVVLEPVKSTIGQSHL